jgi:hypothetical protein
MFRRLLALSLSASLVSVFVGCENADAPKSPTNLPKANAKAADNSAPAVKPGGKRAAGTGAASAD